MTRIGEVWNSFTIKTENIRKVLLSHKTTTIAFAVLGGVGLVIVAIGTICHGIHAGYIDNAFSHLTDIAEGMTISGGFICLIGFGGAHFFYSKYQHESRIL